MVRVGVRVSTWWSKWVFETNKQKNQNEPMGKGEACIKEYPIESGEGMKRWVIQSQLGSKLVQSEYR